MKVMAVNAEQSYIEIFNEFHQTLCSKSAPLLNQYRDAAFRSFESAGFPTHRLESHKYTDLADAFALNYGMNINRVEFPVNSSDLIKCEVQGINSYVFFLVNDSFYCPEFSKPALDELRSKGLLIGSLNEYATTHPDLVGQYYNKMVHENEDATVSFNTAFAQDGFFLYVPKGVCVEKPIQIISVMHSSVPTMANARNLIVLDENSQARVLVCAHTMEDVEFLSNRVTEVFVNRNAVYDHYKLENTHSKSVSIGSLFIKQMGGSNVLVNDITLHNGLTRNNVTIDLAEEHCETLLCGMAVEDRKEHVDNTTFINHLAPKCKSNETYKYVLDGESTGAFAGKIYVAPHAQKTEAYQVNRNVCMKTTAKMNTKPQLEIYADDVKCSHGASTGQMDDNALFYLRSRGIPETEAKMMLMYAFVNDVLENVRIEALKDKIKLLVEKRFRGELSKCSGCNVCK